MTIQPQRAKVSEIISSAITIFKHAIHVKNIELNVHYDGEVETLSAFRTHKDCSRSFEFTFQRS
jgi:hypothetical protein